MGSFSHTSVSSCLPSSSEVAGDISEKSPYLISVLSVLSEPFVLAGFALTLDLTLESLLTLEPDITPTLLSARIALPLPDSPSLTLLTSFGNLAQGYLRAFVGVLAARRNAHAHK